MSHTHILPTISDVYWFIDLGADIISGVTEPGMRTSTDLVVEQNEDKELLIINLEEKRDKLKENGNGFCLQDDTVVFLDLPVAA